MRKRKHLRRARVPARRREAGKQPTAAGALTLEQARALVLAEPSASARRAKAVRAGPRAKRAARPIPSIGVFAAERKRLDLERRAEHRRRTQEYTAVLRLLERRGLKAGRRPARRAPRAKGARAPSAKPAGPVAAVVSRPLRVLAEGDSWFDYPVPFFGGGIVTRLERRLGVPILNVADAGDEVRFMLGVEQRRKLSGLLADGCPAGGPWDVLLFSGGGNDIVDNPMALWIRKHDPSLTPQQLIHQPRFDAALSLVRAGYEDLIAMRDRQSPTTHLFFHTYDFAIPDGRGICHLGPWLKPTFELRDFPSRERAAAVVRCMLQQFAAMLKSLAAKASNVSVLDGQGTLAPTPESWHNELHPSKDGFETFAEAFAQALGKAFPDRVP